VVHQNRNLFSTAAEATTQTADLKRYDPPTARRNGGLVASVSERGTRESDRYSDAGGQQADDGSERDATAPDLPT